ncbi:copper resistance protein CopC [uncultured Exiguobacterium sp.]|uniref:copper resistance CopC family protein n=2 Tax=uncultured Exiguobacterium sp. TaxID=202669 RepID=UPI0025D19EB4|nr:copper resistance protein CopC [uncultured Exiguobacterium sp.]
MQKVLYFFAFVFGFFVCYPMNAFAHTGLESSNPAANDTVEPIDTIVLNFESNIEEGGSLRVYPAGASKPLEGTYNQGSRKMQMTWERPLTSGSYRVDWKIIGTDGHPINGTYSFVVASKEKTSTTTDTAPDSRAKDEVRPKPKTMRSADDGSVSPLLIAGGFLVLGIYFFSRIVLRGRKR